MNICKLTISPFSKREESRYDVHVHVIHVKTKDKKEDHTYVRIRKNTLSNLLSHVYTVNKREISCDYLIKRA